MIVALQASPAAAAIRGVMLFEPLRLTSAPLSISARTISRAPKWAATETGQLQSD